MKKLFLSFAICCLSLASLAAGASAGVYRDISTTTTSAKANARTKLCREQQDMWAHAMDNALDDDIPAGGGYLAGLDIRLRTEQVFKLNDCAAWLGENIDGTSTDGPYSGEDPGGSTQAGTVNY